MASLTTFGSQALKALIPLLVWLIFDLAFGTLIGLISGFGMALIQIIWDFLRIKRIELSLILDLGLILVFGLPELISDDILPPGLTFILIEIVTIALLLPAFFGRIPRVLTNGLDLPTFLTPLLIKSARFLMGVLGLHVVLGLLAMLSAPPWYTPLGYPGIPLQQTTDHAILTKMSGAWYWIFAGLAFFVVLRIRPKSRTKASSEWLAVVDSGGREIARARRELLHARPDLIQLVVRLIIKNPKDGKILLRKSRPPDQNTPEIWETACTGHVRAGEAVTMALKRKAKERFALELDDFFKPDDDKDQSIHFLGSYLYQDRFESEFSHLWFLEYSGKIKLSHHGAKNLAWLSHNELHDLAEKHLLTPKTTQDYTLLTQFMEIAGSRDEPHGD